MIHPKLKGLVQVYTGEGKGKTTIALGLAMRAIGHGFSVCMIQFLKGGSYLGELIAAEGYLPRLHIFQFGKDCPRADKIREGIVDCGTCRECFLPDENEKARAEKALVYAESAATYGKYDVVILDEINMALNKKLIPIETALKLITHKSSSTELILTGRDAPKEISEAADLVTEMHLVKHPFEAGVNSRVGIEY
jgi:cob(I)alamin adenosyltransferase